MDQLKQRANLVVIVLSLIFAFLLFRLYRIQVSNHGKYVERQQSQFYLKQTIPPRAGMIFSRNGKLLAISNLVHSVHANPQVIKNKPAIIAALSRTLKLPAEKIQAKVDSFAARNKKFVWIKRRIPAEEYQPLKDMNLKGVGFREEYKRFYPNGSLACHVLGYRGLDEKALDGAELTCDQWLMGESGYRYVLRDARQKNISSLESLAKPPKPGKNVYLTIDTVIQFIVEKALDKAWEKWKPLSISAIVLDPRTGEVLALANRPNFDPNRYNKYSDSDRRNRAVTDQVEPGSTGKPFIAAAVVDRSLAKTTDKFFCENGTFNTGFRTIHDHHPFGELDLSNIVIQSSNIGMAKLGMLLGKEKMFYYIKKFGFGQATGLGLPGEVNGKITPYSRWDRFTITSVPMGHEIAVNSVQLAKAYAVFANGGFLLKPQLIAKVTEPLTRGQDKTIKKFDTELIRRVLKPETYQQMNDILIQVVNQGTGTRARIAGYQVAGKTGTTTKLNPDGTYSHTRFISLFAGYAPAEKPRVLALVMVNEPQGAYYGGTVSAPVVARIIEQTLTYWGMPKRITMAREDN